MDRRELTHAQYRKLLIAQLEIIRALCQGVTLTDEEVLMTTPTSEPECPYPERPSNRW